MGQPQLFGMFQLLKTKMCKNIFKNDKSYENNLKTNFKRTYRHNTTSSSSSKVFVSTNERFTSGSKWISGDSGAISGSCNTKNVLDKTTSRVSVLEQVNNNILIGFFYSINKKDRVQECAHEIFRLKVQGVS